MIFRLLGMLRGNALEAVVTLLIGAWAAVFVYNKAMERTNPLAQIGEPGRVAQMYDVKEAERSAKEYAELRSLANEKLLVSNHEEILRRLDVVANDLNRLTKSTEALGERVFELQGKIPQGRHSEAPSARLKNANLATPSLLPYPTSL